MQVTLDVEKLVERVFENIKARAESAGYEFERRGDEAVLQSGYGPCDDRSAIFINVRDAVLVATGATINPTPSPERTA